MEASVVNTPYKEHTIHRCVMSDGLVRWEVWSDDMLCHSGIAMDMGDGWLIATRIIDVMTSMLPDPPRAPLGEQVARAEGATPKTSRIWRTESPALRRLARRGKLKRFSLEVPQPGRPNKWDPVDHSRELDELLSRTPSELDEARVRDNASNTVRPLESLQTDLEVSQWIRHNNRKIRGRRR